MKGTRTGPVAFSHGALLSRPLRGTLTSGGHSACSRVHSIGPCRWVTSGPSIRGNPYQVMRRDQ